MPLLNVALNNFADAIIGGTDFAKFNAANARIAVGNGTAAFNPAHTGLQGASQFRMPMESGFPARNWNHPVNGPIGENAVAFRGIAGEDDANFAWEEWGVVNHASAGQFLNRKVQSLGTKTTSISRQITVTLAVVQGS